MITRLLLAIVASACLITGCAGPRTAFYGVTEEQLKTFTTKALSLEQNTPRTPGNLEPNRQFDSSKPIRYWMQSGKRPKIWIYIPLREKDGSGYSYGAWRFDVASGKIDGAGLVPHVESR